MLTKGVKVALLVALVAYFLSRGDMRTTLFLGGTAIGADMLL